VVNLVNTAEGQAARNLEGRLSVTEAQDDFKARVVKQNLDLNFHDAPTQLEGINYAQAQLKALKVKAGQVANSTWPDTTKNAYLGNLKARENQLDSITRTASSNLQSLDHEAHAAAMHAQSEANANARHSQVMANEAKRDAKAAAQERLNGNKDDALNKMYKMQQDLYVASQDKRNMQAVQQKATELYKYQQDMHDAGYLSPAQANAGGMFALHTASSAATWQEKPPSVMGKLIPSLNHGPSKMQRLKAQDAIDAQTKSLKAVQDGAAAMYGLSQQSQAAKVVLTPEQHKYHDDQLAGWMNARVAAGRAPSTDERKQFSMKLMNLAAKKFPSQHQSGVTSEPVKALRFAVFGEELFGAQEKDEGEARKEDLDALVSEH
jgi:hypothetical protein